MLFIRCLSRTTPASGCCVEQHSLPPISSFFLFSCSSPSCIFSPGFSSLLAIVLTFSLSLSLSLCPPSPSCSLPALSPVLLGGCASGVQGCVCVTGVCVCDR